MNELDALANINFQTREENDNFRQRKSYVSVLVEDYNLILPWELIYALKSL